VNATLRAAQRTALAARLCVYAIEKNPNAVQTLRNAACEAAWQEAGVRVVASDMREWRAPEQAHVLVSELLGSFGDNELSPECLDGAVPHLRSTGVSVPCAYTSYVAPVCTPKIWSELHAQGDAARLETPYVVKLQQVFHCCGAPQACFTFTHAPVDPRGSTEANNRRYTHLRFVCGTEAAVVHGFAGYFECTLAEGAALMSTAPHSASPGMFSWFPLLLPLRVPVSLAPNQAISVHLWRCVSPRKVWYEWALSEPYVSALHNPNGRSYAIGL
jgi:protein arginine N-methyltransferase 5